ncbi:hypothetical protein T484DRAFT_1862567 [Baffinella frigidus]|nr:hypothetical protein T484DRAFT_1862567 [Cryptophyta sp. CCMP2293]
MSGMQAGLGDMSLDNLIYTTVTWAVVAITVFCFGCITSNRSRIMKWFTSRVSSRGHPFEEFQELSSEEQEEAVDELEQSFGENERILIVYAGFESKGQPLTQEQEDHTYKIRVQQAIVKSQRVKASLMEHCPIYMDDLLQTHDDLHETVAEFKKGHMTASEKVQCMDLMNKQRNKYNKLLNDPDFKVMRLRLVREDSPGR